MVQLSLATILCLDFFYFISIYICESEVGLKISSNPLLPALYARDLVYLAFWMPRIKRGTLAQTGSVTH